MNNIVVKSFLKWADGKTQLFFLQL